MGSLDLSSLRGFTFVCCVLVTAGLGLRVAFVDPQLGPAAAPSSDTKPPPPTRIAKIARPATATTAPPAPAKRGYHDGSTLKRTAHYWSNATVTELLESGADVNVRGGTTGQTPLLFAALAGRHQFIKPLLDAGADPLARDYLGRDAYSEMIHLWRKGYMLAIKDVVDRIRAPQNLEVIEFIASGDPQHFTRWLASDPDLETHWDLARTPLLWSLYYDRQQFAEELMARGARLDVVDYRGHTPLHFAAMNGNVQLVRELRAAGAELNITNDYGQTALALSLFAPDLRVMSHLLASGADPCIGPQDKSDVLELARSTTAGNEAVAIRLLLPEIARHACTLTAEAARRANAREFTRRLVELSPPSDFVAEHSETHLAFKDAEAMKQVAQRLYGEITGAKTAESLRDITRTRRAMGYRSLLAHPDDEDFGFAGASVWTPHLDREDMEIELAIDQLRLEHFFYFDSEKECLICDPGENVNGISASMVTSFQANHLVRAGRLLEAVDVSEKFLRERIADSKTLWLHGVFKGLVRPLWLLGRHAEAFAVGDAELIREYGSAEGKARKNHLGYVLDHMVAASDDPE